LEFDGNLELENYIGQIQAIERIIELKEDNDEKAFNLAILKLKGYVSLWYETLKKSRVREAKSKIKNLSKLKNTYRGDSYLLRTSKNSTLRSPLLAKRISR